MSGLETRSLNGTHSSPELIRSTIKDLVRAANSKKGKEKYQVFLTDEREDAFSAHSLFTTFINSPLATEVYTHGVTAIFDQLNKRDFIDNDDKQTVSSYFLKARLTGSVLAHLAFGYLSTLTATTRTGETLISGDGTLAIWKKLYPSAKELPKPFGQTSLDRNVPDGLLIGPTTYITEVIEAKSSVPINSRLGSQIKSFESSIKEYPSLYKKPKFRLVTPEIENLPPDVKNNPHVEHTQLPFPVSSLRNFCESFYVGYRPDSESASLSEIWDYEVQKELLVPYHPIVLFTNLSS